MKQDEDDLDEWLMGLRANGLPFMMGGIDNTVPALSVIRG